MRPLAVIALFLGAVSSSFGQDDVTTRSGSSAYDGAWITGPASNPLSFLNGPAYRTFGKVSPYLLPDFAPASLLNEQLPHWIQFGVEERLRFESVRSDSYELNRFRLQMTLQFRPWLKVVSQVQDSRPFLQNPPYGPPNQNRWDLKLAYAEFGDPETKWISVRVGRQIINYNNTIIANSEWRNQARSYDAAVVNLHYQRYRLGIFAASVVNPLSSGISHHQEGNNIYGLYGGIDRLLPDSVLEPFVLWRVKPGHIDEKAYGFRFKGLAGRRLDYSYEAVVERGSGNLSAWGQTFGAGYRFNNVAWHPRAFAQYDYASPTFDTMYPTAHDRFGIADQFTWQNIEAARAGVTVEPHRRWTATAQYLDLWLASGKSGNHIGEEVDAYTWLELNRHVNVGVGVGHLMLKKANSPAYNYPYFAVNFKDDGRSNHQ